MNKLENPSLMLQLFNYKKTLTLEQVDIERQVTRHMELLHNDGTGKQLSQLQVIKSLNEKLLQYSYDSTVKKVLENINTMLAGDELFYELENLYQVLEQSNQGMVYRPTMKVVLDIINETNVRNQQVKILNELALHDWIPSVKNFILKYTTDPKERQNISSTGGKSCPVYSIVEKIKTDDHNGFLTYIGDKWFFINEDSIETNKQPSDFIQDLNKLKNINALQTALQIGTIDDKTISFQVDEKINIGISFATGDLFINGEKANKNATVDSIFESVLLPFMRRDLYFVISEAYKNLNKFIDLDLVQKVTNITNPFLECYAFNYKDKMYLYTIDKRSGSNFYEYDSATLLCNEMQNKCGYDLSDFLKNKFSKEIQMKKDLENKAQTINHKINDINESLMQLEISGMLDTSKELKNAYGILVAEKKNCEAELFTINSVLSNNKYKL